MMRSYGRVHDACEPRRTHAVLLCGPPARRRGHSRQWTHTEWILLGSARSVLSARSPRTDQPGLGGWDVLRLRRPRRLEELQRVIEPYLADGNRTLAVIREIDASGDLHLPQLWSASSRRRPPEHLDHPLPDVRRCVLPIEVLKGVAPIDRGIRSSRHLLRASRPKKLRHAALP